jgi:hypothetical protein
MDQGLKQAKVMVKGAGLVEKQQFVAIDSGLQITLIRDITTIHIMGVVLRKIVFKILLNRLFKKVLISKINFKFYQNSQNEK